METGVRLAVLDTEQMRVHNHEVEERKEKGITDVHMFVVHFPIPFLSFLTGFVAHPRLNP